jgi:hypothetical protein
MALKIVRVDTRLARPMKDQRVKRVVLGVPKIEVRSRLELSSLYHILSVTLNG